MSSSDLSKLSIELTTIGYTMEVSMGSIETSTGTQSILKIKLFKYIISIIKVGLLV